MLQPSTQSAMLASNAKRVAWLRLRLVIVLILCDMGSIQEVLKRPAQFIGVDYLHFRIDESHRVLCR